MIEYRTKRVPKWITWYNSVGIFPTKHVDFADRDNCPLYSAINLDFKFNIRFYTLPLFRRC
jgi:hypothetical protein